MLKKIWKFIDGHKTEAVAIGVAIATILQANGITIPEYVWGLLAAAGLGAVRHAIKKNE